LDLPPWLAGELTSLLDHHLRLVASRSTCSTDLRQNGSAGSGTGCIALGRGDDLLDLRDRIAEALGQPCWPTGDREGDPYDYRQ
jgi:hypothetical protein